MSRSLRNEVLVAIGAILLLGIAILFGVLISENSPEEEPAETTATALSVSNSNVTVPSETAEQTATIDEETSQTVTATLPVITRISPDASATDTSEPTQRPTRSGQASNLTTTVATDIVAESTEVETEIAITETETETPEPTNTSTVTASATATDVPPTATNTFTVTPSATNTATATSTSTSTPTETPEPTNTPTATSTPTPTITPTITPTVTRTPRPSEISPLLPTLTPLSTEVGLLPTLTAMAMDGATGVNPSGCSAPNGWVLYVVQPGNTLFSIAQASGSTVSELSSVNCLPDVNRITTGDVLFVPRVPVLPIVPTMSGGMSSGGYSAVGCTNPAVQITRPAIGQRVSGVFDVVGNASYGDSFGYYSLQIRSDSSATYNFYSRSENPVLNGVLGQMDAGLFSPGLYWIRILIVDNTGNVASDSTCVIPILID